RVLSKYDIITVGECAGVTLEEAKKYANAEGTELNMVFQFEHVSLDHDPYSKWSTKRMDLVDLKKNLTKWQEGLNEIAWNSLFYCNHDQPRIVSRLGDDSPAAAKCIATQLHMMQGTPYVYQGEELGMTNCPFGPIENYNDLDCVNAYWELTGAGLREPEELLEAIAMKSRDNARTPMQWSDAPNAGFTTGKPWLMVNPNYVTINAEAQVKDPDSVFHYYKKLIGLRRSSQWSDIIVYGNFALLAPEDKKVFAYVRCYEGKQLLVICNMSAEETEFTVPAEVQWSAAQAVVGTNAPEALDRTMALKPWSASVWAI
ncbi:MAG: alpha-glucosidase C-terminal domain-containing protein, partial [Oscillospiraceae bacterium]|nr:alpha-glucosidase C-terminal domain-containing protein [Oscillospiraceae bacterium]